MFQNSPNQSPVNQDFIWLAEYADSTYLSEFDFKTQKENEFNTIIKDDLIRFGLIGCGHKMYFESFGGSFKISGKMIDFIYTVDDKNYYLTCSPLMYKDIITYKDAESTINLGGGNGAVSRINQYNFGYKQKIKLGDVNFIVQIICQIPFDEPVRFNIKLVSDKNLDGKLLILKNGMQYYEVNAPLRKSIGGELNWVLS